MFTVRVPATSANLGPGFDTLGMALDLYLNIDIELSYGMNQVVYLTGVRAQPRNIPAEDLVLKAMHMIFEKVGREIPPLKVTIHNEIPIGCGLGSSAAAIVAGLSAANFMIGQKYSRNQLMNWAFQMEGHADNVVPAMVGGLTTAMVYEGKVYYQRLSLPETIKIVAVVPDFVLSTAEARAVLPEKVDLKDTIANLQRACYLLASIYNGDTRHIHMAMDDVIYQPLRKHLIPGFESVFEMAADAGALGVALSGAGPTIVAFCTGDEGQVGQVMMEAFASHGVDSRVLYLNPSAEGVKILGKR
ncbi:MAG: homoserine kinase [Deltaproteobacteria bacterium]